MTEEQSEENVYDNVGEFVHHYLIGLYQRQVTDMNDTVWCPQWWKHYEAVTRLNALWKSFEFYSRDTEMGLSNWLLDHADRHMAVLFHPRGPFKYCSVRHGHKDMLDVLPVEDYPTGLFSHPDGIDFALWEKGGANHL